MNNSNYQIIDEWQSAIAIYLEHREQVSITELLQSVFNFELGKIERRDQMRVANILTNLKWKKVGQKQHQGKRQVVWRCDPASHGIPLRISAQDALGSAPKPIPPPKSPDIEEVQQLVTQLPQELSIPTTPSIANTETGNHQTENTSSEKTIKIEQSKSTGVDPQVKEATTAWLTYPYQSKDIYTLKNRAYKVKERVLNASTKGELVSLYAQSLITASEVKWLKSNLLSGTELNRLNQIEATVQTNIFNQDEHKDLKTQTTKEVRRIGWNRKQGIAYIKERYGVSDRAEMSIKQLTEFRDYLKTLPNK